MEVLIVGLTIFFGAHCYSAFRSREAGSDIKERLGEAKYMGIYSLVSLLGFGLLIWGYSLAQPGQYLFVGIAGARDVAVLVMVPALILLVASQLPPGHIKSLSVHPMLIAIALWGIAHLLDGADLRQLLLFGTFLLYSLIDIPAVNRRTRQASSAGNSGAQSTPKLSYDLIAVAIAAVVFLALVYGLHDWLFGRSALV
ncbi:MAG: NnrU family protein [Pseudomonadota bacterium]